MAVTSKQTNLVVTFNRKVFVQKLYCKSALKFLQFRKYLKYPQKKGKTHFTEAVFHY